MDNKTYRVSTLGCRVNRADSLAIERELNSMGFKRAASSEVPTIWVVNTCAVTSEGMRKSRKLVRRCAKSGASVVVTGCGVGMDAGAFRVDGVDAIVPNEMKPQMLGDESSEYGCRLGADEADGWMHDELVRVPVKVQDGCMRYCTYCIVPYVRPKPYSRTTASVMDEIRLLKELGVGEVILCGIDLGSYRDPTNGKGIDSLAAAVTARSGDMWVRLSSIELSDVSDGLLNLLCEGESLCRHLHIPLQSGDASVLKDMGRKYTPEEFCEKVEKIRKQVGEIALTTDVMVGFPTEDEKAFRGTKNMISSLGFSRVHVFKYSRRPNTNAYDLGDPVDSFTKRRRADEIRKLAATNALRFHEGFVGRIIPVLIEAVMDGVTLDSISAPQAGGENEMAGYLFGRTENFAGMVIKGEANLVGSVVQVHVTGSGSEGLRGRIINRQVFGSRGR